MALTVFAEKMGFFHKGCAGIGIAPLDVCLSPPPGPVPIPYTNVLFAKDLIKGSKTVKIDGEPTFLEDHSETSTSIGDEGGTLGGSVVTGVILGKGYFMVWSMTVQIEGLGVCRHGDMMGQNSASAPPSSIDAAAVCKPSPVKAPVPGPVASRRAAEAKVLKATGPGDSKPAKVVPCDFAKIAVKCSHSGSGDGKRGFGPIEYTYSGKIKDNLPRPKRGSKRTFTNNIQLVAGEDDRRADKISIELTGGPGYGCSHKHPVIMLTDGRTGEVTKKAGQTKLELPLKSRRLPLPNYAMMSPGAIIAYFFFPPKAINSYTLQVSSCGVLADKSPGFRQLSRRIDVYPSDTYKLSLSIPQVVNRKYAKTGTRKLESGAKWAGGKDDGWDKGWRDGSDWFGEGKDGGAPPVKTPIKEVGASIKLERNSEDIKATAKLGEIINTFINLQNKIQAVMNFIEEFQPQVGWTFNFAIGFFAGDLAFEWGAKEANDHMVFRWWKFEAGLTLVSLELEVSFGVKFRVCLFRFVAVIFGKVSGEAKLSTSCEATPQEPSWETKVGVEIKGELGIKAALGADWVSAEGKFELGFPFEAVPKITEQDGLKIDYKLEFSGLSATIIGHLPIYGNFSRKFDIMKKSTLGSGTFPSGQKNQTGIPSQQGAIK